MHYKVLHKLHLSGEAPAALNARLVAADAGAGALLIPTHTVWDENWTVAGGRPTRKHVCTTNANNANRTIVLAEITLGQLINYLEREFPTVRRQQNEALFGITVQGNDAIGRYYTKLRKIARIADMGEPEFRRKFIGGLSRDNQVEIRLIGFNKEVEELLTK